MAGTPNQRGRGSTGSGACTRPQWGAVGAPNAEKAALAPPCSEANADALVEPDRLAHGGLEGERLNVLPVLLEKRDQEVDGLDRVLDDLKTCVGHAVGLQAPISTR